MVVTVHLFFLAYPSTTINGAELSFVCCCVLVSDFEFDAGFDEELTGLVDATGSDFFGLFMLTLKYGFAFEMFKRVNGDGVSKPLTRSGEKILNWLNLS